MCVKVAEKLQIYCIITNQSATLNQQNQPMRVEPMTKVTEELIAQFNRMHRRGDSFRAIGAKFGVDPRTVKSGIEKGGKQRDQDHWEAVSRQVDVRYLEEHLGMLVRVLVDVQRAVQSSPLQPYREPMALVAGLVQAGLDQTGGLLEGRGVELYSPDPVSPTDGGHRLPAARLVGKLLEGLIEHEPTLKELLDGWSSCWIEVQEEHSDLQEKAKNLFLQKQIAKETADALGPVAVEQAIASALGQPDQGHLTAEAGDDGLATLVSGEGTNSERADAELARLANEWVVGQLLHEENIRRFKEAYSSLTENVARIEDLGDNIFLRGKPAGTCFLCPKDSRV